MQVFEWGADIVTHSTTKYMDGHGAAVGGCIVDSGRFDWTKYPEKFPGLCTPDDSYHGVTYTERFGLRIVCGTNLTAQGLLAGILQEEDDEDQCVMFGSSTANFSAVPAAKHQWNRPLSSVQPPRAGMMVFGVLRANGTMELANTQPTLHVDDKILFAELAD